MCAAAGAGIGSAKLSGADTAVAVVVFTLIAGSTVAIPVVGYAVAKERMRHPLDELMAWLQTNITAVMAAPSIEDNRTRLIALPIVVPNPRSNVCAENAA